MKKRILLGSISMLFSTLGYTACTPIQGFLTTDIKMNIGRVIVKATDQIGTILKKSQINIAGNNSTVYCNNTMSIFGGLFGISWGSNQGGIERDNTVYATLSKQPQLSNLGDSIYNTNIPGIGIRLYREVFNYQSFSGYYPYSRKLQSPQTYRLGEGYFVIEVIKTANQTGSGTLSPGRYSSYYTDGFESLPILTSTIYGDTVSITSASCSIQGDANKLVRLPTVTNTGFKGIGSTQGEQAFNINISCNGGASASNYQESSQIGLSFDFSPDPTTNQAIENTATSNSKASGVGVQLISDYNNQNKIITKNSSIFLGSVQTNQNASYQVPLRARYYQTNTRVNAGEVKALATLTIDYQ